MERHLLTGFGCDKLGQQFGNLAGIQAVDKSLSTGLAPGCQLLVKVDEFSDCLEWVVVYAPLGL